MNYSSVSNAEGKDRRFSQTIKREESCFLMGGCKINTPYFARVNSKF